MLRFPAEVNFRTVQAYAVNRLGDAKFGAGEVINYTVYKASGVVDSITAVPSAASGSPSPGA
jgi:hypothetical protein